LVCELIEVMKRYIGLMFGTFLVTACFVLFSSSLNAQSQDQSSGPTELKVAPDYILPPQTEPGFLGQDHNYTLVFRGNGEAVVSAKIAFTNKSESPLTELKLRIPRVEPKEVFVYQVILQNRCVRYDPSVYNPVTRTYGQQVCAEYQEPSYYDNYWGGARYQKAKTQIDIDTLTVTLPKEISANKSGAFFVYLRAFGYTKKNILGAYDYTFESLKAEESIRNLRVGISSDSDLFLKGAKGEVTYRLEETAFQSFGKAGVSAPEANTAFDSFVSQIGYGSIVKTASNLAALESYKVEGTYADSRLKLYGKEIAIAILVILFLGTFIVLFIRFIIKRVNKSAFPEVRGTGSKPDSVSGNSRMLLISLGVSFVSSIIILFYTILVFFLGNYLNRLISYQFQAVITLLLIVISFVIYSLLLFSPGVYMGVKKSVGWGITTVVLTLLWLIIYFIIAVFVVFLLFGTGTGPITPLYGAVKAE